MLPFHGRFSTDLGHTETLPPTVAMFFPQPGINAVSAPAWSVLHRFRRNLDPT